MRRVTKNVVWKHPRSQDGNLRGRLGRPGAARPCRLLRGAAPVVFGVLFLGLAAEPALAQGMKLASGSFTGDGTPSYQRTGRTQA